MSTQPTGLLVNVEGIGPFVFDKRTMRNQIAIECEYSRQTEGLTHPTPFLGNLATRMADLMVLTVTAPKGWMPADLMEKDAWDEDTYAQIEKVWGALRDKEAEFRRRLQTAPAGEAAGEQDELVVPPAV